MLTEELETAIQAGDAAGCRALLQGASEAERRTAAPLALKWHVAARARWMNEIKHPELVFPDTREELMAVGNAASVAFIGTTTLGEVKRLGWAGHFLAPEAYAALADRRPAWLAEWADWILGENRGAWRPIRDMVREGVLPRPTVDAYTTAMIGHLWPRDPLPLLREDPDLLEHEVWRLFEVEGGGEDSLAARDKFQHTGKSWSAALITLAEEGSLDRQRLLTASLEALQRDFSQFRVGWFSRFHELLKPTVEERAERVEIYLALLGSPIPPTVSFALKALALLDKAGRLPAERLIEHVAPALGAREKGTVSQALKLVDRALRSDTSLRPTGVRVAAEALIHEAAEVQGLALDLVEKYGEATDAELTATLTEYLEGVAASQRARLEQWLGQSSTPEPAVPDGETADELLARVGELPDDLRELAGVEAVLEATRAGSLAFPALDLRDLRIPRLDPTTRLEPVADLDTLIELYSQVLENDGPPDDIERVLDGVSRLCAERPADWEPRVAPLRKRAKALAARSRTSLRDDLCRLALAWLSGEVTDPGWNRMVRLLCFSANRVLALSVRATSRQAGPLLAAPTHAGGWVAPQTLVERVRALQSAPPAEPPALSPAVQEVLGTSAAEHLRFDAVQALLRLAPEGRSEALAAAEDLEGELGDAVRYALGAEGIEIGPTAALWVAAGRARQPWGEIPTLEARHPGLGPGAGREVQAQIEFRECSSEYSDETWISKSLATEPPTPDTASLDLPTVLQYTDTKDDSLHYQAPADQRWCATFWPLNREGWSAVGAYMLINNIDWWEAEWANRVRLEVLLDADTHLGTMERQMLLFGLGAKEPGEASLATDIAIAAIQDGRLTATSLGQTLLETLVMDGVKGARLAKTLGEVARSSTLHALTVKLALEHGMAAAAAQKPADLGALLELLQELCVQTGTAMTDAPGREALESLTGGGKAAKLKKAVLAVTATDAAAAHVAGARAQALAGRLDRACRWAVWRESREAAAKVSFTSGRSVAYESVGQVSSPSRPARVEAP